MRAKNGREIDKLCFIEARKTKGMYGDEISKAAKEFITTGKISQKASFQYRNPYTGEFPELGLNPFKLLSALKNQGFQC